MDNIQALYQKAMKFAGEKHRNQTVPGSTANYLLHLSNVAMEILVIYIESPSFDLALAVQTAILHDTLEDTDATYEELEEQFGMKVAEAVLALTKNPTLVGKRQKMEDSVNRINALGPEVGMVKLADRITNLQAPPAHWSQDKRGRYLDEAVFISEQLTGKHAYLEARLRDKIEGYREFV
ncbi:MAG TPA: bifunctional (p)ppGpp synthetase/guanosine-3',5'-bis(diphosphate) 3'-pyrophosphohydrolase [Cytophagales bacterium]|nr:bifunctional (p)ppGpp synthetase/guanosine-3',5'-bis(diphosphate) 3'-pyrophosphohydrolase [Cytophagales bacterium]HAA22512.1 bifunctional (p)ppGpp synthetase/guanosine-3',5'-bis(diphosphate) 3'-pyrophosphohydrolase [Cytophagales bacterium]HAP61382.1 bifunctional (p)ppGpp synthetase/guanosine-3',5'-bis(diphosphate) 3'-pyrophosphohydrolase [Cytophagales bacterium]